MTVLTNLCSIYLAMSIFATKCNDNQHCSDCNSTTGHCITGCESGYYDKKCMSVCGNNCRNKKCIMSNTGNDYCTEGCVLGYQGPGCGKPCYNPGGTCTACPGGCDGGYCQLGSSCVSGCVDSYYGTCAVKVIDMNLKGMRNITVIDNETVTFRCVVQGYPPPDVVSIVHAGNHIPAMDMVRKNNTVHERAVRISSCSQLGRYYCRVTSSSGIFENHLLAVELQASPRKHVVNDCETEAPQNGKAPSGRITFTLCAYPDPVLIKLHFERHKPPKDITHINKYNYAMKMLMSNIYEYTLTISNIAEEDFGAYTFSFAYDEREIDILIIASQPKESTDLAFCSIAIIIGTSVVCILLVFIAVACLLRWKNDKDYWNARCVQPYITPTHSTHVTLENSDGQGYEDIRDSRV
ncbi:uncharacterized protein LOC124128875 [Haliotis rufescens]|uniref:uncharacterized protein LOC124128875 n=1 Tax=Haliotis rufescens TaxID=6454 RepID=UPI00201F15DC|nr:uncharacterized protein LOC124128875 [Haliotis rufescens]